MTDLEPLTSLFAYPGERYRQCADTCARASESVDLREFAARIAPMSVGEIQERFVQAFDLNPAATLEIGWHLFGEQYERGEFLVGLRKKLREAGVAEIGELPDHLLHVLPLVERLEPADAHAFAEKFLRPALEKILAGLPKDSVFVSLVRGAIEACSGQWAEKVEVRR